MAVNSTIEIDIADVIVILGYFVSVIGVGIWSSTRNRGSVGGYFLAGRNMHWMLVGASLFASNIGSGHFIGLAGSGAASGIGIANFEFNAIFILMALGWLFVPVYLASGVYTMPEYLKKRFGGQRIRIYLAFLALILYIFTKISADLYAGAMFIELALHWDIWFSIIILLAIAALFTVTGGLTAVIWTDFVQTIIMVIGASILAVLSFIRVRGFDALIWEYGYSRPNITKMVERQPVLFANMTAIAACGLPDPNYMRLVRSANDHNYPWPGMFIGLTVSSVWYWCTDQVIVQRALASKDYTHAKAGCILAGYLKVLPLWLMVFPGMIARVLFPDEVACVEPDVCLDVCGSEAGCTNIAYPLLVIRVMPTGLRGVMLAVMMASLMSSLTSIFNSASTIFTMDVWRHFRHSATETELMIVGRVFVLGLVAVSIAWVPVVRQAPELFHYIQAMQAFLAPPICAVFLLGVFWGRINELGAFTGLMSGMIVGLFRFIWEYSYTVPPCGEEHLDTRPLLIKRIHYMHFGIILCAVSAAVAIAVSLLTKPIPEKHLVRLTFWTRHSTQPRVDIDTGEVIPDNSAPLTSEAQTTKAGTEGESSGQCCGKKLPRFLTELVDTSGVDEYGELPAWKKALLWFCGIENMHRQGVTEAPSMHPPSGSDSIAESPRHRRLADINGLILTAAAVFVVSYFF